MTPALPMLLLVGAWSAAPAPAPAPADPWEGWLVTDASTVALSDWRAAVITAGAGLIVFPGLIREVDTLPLDLSPVAAVTWLGSHVLAVDRDVLVDWRPGEAARVVPIALPTPAPLHLTVEDNGHLLAWTTAAPAGQQAWRVDRWSGEVEAVAAPPGLTAARARWRPGSAPILVEDGGGAPRGSYALEGRVGGVAVDEDTVALVLDGDVLILDVQGRWGRSYTLADAAHTALRTPESGDALAVVSASGVEVIDASTGRSRLQIAGAADVRVYPGPDQLWVAGVLIGANGWEPRTSVPLAPKASPLQLRRTEKRAVERVDPATGALIWAAPLPGNGTGALKVVGGMLVVEDPSGASWTAWDLETGAPLGAGAGRTTDWPVDAPWPADTRPLITWTPGQASHLRWLGSDQPPTPLAGSPVPVTSLRDGALVLRLLAPGGQSSELLVAGPEGVRWRSPTLHAQLGAVQVGDVLCVVAPTGITGVDVQTGLTRWYRPTRHPATRVMRVAPLPEPAG